jgi:hypothetical protein
VPPAVERFTVTIVQVNPSGKTGPLLTSTADLEPSSSNSAELVYQPNVGWVSKIRIGGVNAGDPYQTCYFDEPSTPSSPKAVITIRPLR